MTDEGAAGEGLSIARLDAFIFRIPLKTPRINSFGKMTHRTALVVRLTDKQGAQGWGECFSNWPAFGAEHRFRILTDILAPKLEGRTFASPAELTTSLTRQVRILRLQADEPGPFDQSISAIDIAAWDLSARLAGKPLYQHLGASGPVESVPYYASGLSPDQALAIAEFELERGTRAFKLKVGWTRESDLKSLTDLRALIGTNATLMVDVNQIWDMETARDMIPRLAPFDLSWIEEPISADHAPADFSELAALGQPVAAGENIRGTAAFDEMMHHGGLSVLQPDIIKWGGITGCMAVARSALKRGLRYCPHYLGGGIGLMATSHLLAAVGGGGLLELDATPNALRDALASPYPDLRDGAFYLPQSPGIGVSPDLEAMAQFLQAQ